MDRYIFIRDYDLKKTMVGTDIVFKKGTLLIENKTSFSAPISEGGIFFDFPIPKEFEPDLSICLLKLDADLLKTVFYSFGYTNWLKEKVADIDDRGDPLYPELSKSPETMIMYLMELGISSDTLMRYIYGPENKYMEYRYLVQEFGKML